MIIRKNLFIIVLIDILLLAAAMYGAYQIRFEFSIPPIYLSFMQAVLPWALIIKLLCFYFFGLYRGMWRYTSIADLIKIIKASSVGTLLIVVYILLVYQFINYPRSVILIDWFLTIIFIAGFRISVRLLFERYSKENPTPSDFLTVLRYLKNRKTESKKLIIIGAGNCAEKIYREIRDNASLQYDVVGFLDDDRNKIGRTIHGIPVLGNIDEISVVAKKMTADESLIAIPSAQGEEMRRIVALCKSSGLPFKTVPGYGELIDGRVSIKSIRDVAYRDLLGRESIQLDEKGIGAYIQDQTLLVTGAGGSIGSELCRQICRFKPSKIVLFERAESPLYDIELELKGNFSGIDIIPVLGDIQDRMQLQNTFQSHLPQTVFHAAAYKHVPMLEIQPWEAVENNIIGTANLIDTVHSFNVDRFVFVSTDKAVRPTNVMGASKRVAEMLIQCRNHAATSNTGSAIVRFGNVVGSVGSVVPLFKKQIEKGGPVTVTHPEVTRYFMTIPEACQLILQAGALSADNMAEIFILDMGTPIKIVDMARDLIRLSGFKPDEDIKIEFVGLRPGEKLFEELITEGEGIVQTQHEKILALNGESCQPETLKGMIETLSRYVEAQDGEGIKAELKKIVSDYQPQ